METNLSRTPVQWGKILRGTLTLMWSLFSPPAKILEAGKIFGISPWNVTWENSGCAPQAAVSHGFYSLPITFSCDFLNEFVRWWGQSLMVQSLHTKSPASELHCTGHQALNTSAFRDIPDPSQTTLTSTTPHCCEMFLKYLSFHLKVFAHVPFTWHSLPQSTCLLKLGARANATSFMDLSLLVPPIPY